MVLPYSSARDIIVVYNLGMSYCHWISLLLNCLLLTGYYKYAANLLYVYTKLVASSLHGPN